MNSKVDFDDPVVNTELDEIDRKLKRKEKLLRDRENHSNNSGRRKINFNPRFVARNYEDYMSNDD
jgi:hypothetical protein